MIIDTHTHLDMKEFDPDRDAVIKRAVAAGVKKIITLGVDLESSQKAVELSQKYPNIYATIGVQPEEVDRYFEDEPDAKFFNPKKIKTDIRTELERLVRENKKIIAIGECGLDYHNLKKESPSAALEGDSFLEIQKEKQKDIFRRQLGLAVLLDLPVIVHNREADEDILAEVERYKDTKKLRGVFHCFTGTLEFARKILELGFLVSFTGIITYPNAQELREVIKKIPLGKVMVETDSPFLSPQSHRGQRNEPAYVIEVVKKIAEIKNLKFEEVCLATSENARGLFRM